MLPIALIGSLVLAPNGPRSTAAFVAHTGPHHFLLCRSERPPDACRHNVQVILMDHVDWMDETYARELAAALARQVTPGGRVIWRSAALEPPYVSIIRDAGFTVRAAALL